MGISSDHLNCVSAASSASLTYIKRSASQTAAMRTIVLILTCALPLAIRAQELPYSIVLAMQQAAEEAKQVDGVTCELQMQHAHEGDSRPFKITLDTPKGQTPITVQPDGAFTLPVLPEEDRDHARLLHNLEKGALSINFQFKMEGRTSQEKEKTMYEVCSGVAEGMSRLDDMWNALGKVSPQFRSMDLAIVGYVLPRTTPINGRMLLKKGDETVKTVDLTETGPVMLMFDDFNPREHRMTWDMAPDVAIPQFRFVFKDGVEASKIKDAVYVRKAQPR